MKLWQLILTGVVVLPTLFYSIFDIYFTSPLVHGMTPYSARGKAPAKRLVLFVADGLRADKFFELDEHKKSRAPFLRSIMTEKGAWGVSHTRVPTETRPGHVALIAGFYEDVSAVAKGWKENPVKFDSVFNESRWTWSWGSPDVLPMFAKGSSGTRVKTDCFPPHYESFGLRDNTKTDTWVFKKVKNFFAAAKKNDTLGRVLNEDKIVFFLHLMGVDTNGHTKKPRSSAYADNIRLVDTGIREAIDIIEHFYQHDGQTAYVMTSDHGMSEWGSHGAGHPHETLTPLVAWGAGVRGPVNNNLCDKSHIDLCNDLQMKKLKRVDVQQADVAPLMSYLAGLPFPVNSVGELPVDYLSGSDELKAEALYTNAQQMLAQFMVQMNQVKERTISVTFRHFRFHNIPSSLWGVDVPPKDKAWLDADFSVPDVLQLKNIRNLINIKKHKDAISESQYVIRTAIQGLRYYQTYDRFFLGLSVTMLFLGWMGCVLHLVVTKHTTVATSACQGRELQDRGNNSMIYFAFGSLGAFIAALLYIQSVPWTNYLYCLTPVVLWMTIAQGWKEFKCGLKQAMDNEFLLPLAVSLVLTVAALEVLVLSFTYRELGSLGLAVMAVWVITTPVWKTDKVTCFAWMTSCAVVAVFPLLPVVHRNTNYPLVLVSGFLALTLGIGMTLRISKSSPSGTANIVSKRVHFIQLLLVAMATMLVCLTWYRTNQANAVHATSWFILGVSPLFPLMTVVSVEVRLFSLCLAFLAPYLLLSITYESMFMLSFMCLLYLWLRIESQLATQHTQENGLPMNFNPNETALNKKGIPCTSRYLDIADLRRAIFYVSTYFEYIFFIFLSFFGTGNIASINSYDPMSVQCFQTDCKPFIMGGLMMLKIGLPFIVVSCILKAVQVVTRVPLRALMLIILLMFNFMGLNFLFLVRDFGSWREIGTSISHYVICMSTTTCIMVVMVFSHILTSWTLPGFSHVLVKWS